MSPRLIGVYATVAKLVSQLHLPVQSGSDRILAAMKRGYTALEYKSIVRRVRAARPDLSLSSDFIVGFPARPRDFDATMRLIDDVGLRRRIQLRLQPAPRHAGRRHAGRRRRRQKQARLERLQSLIRRAVPPLQRSDGRPPRARPRHRPRTQGRRDLQGRSANNRVVNFAGPPTLVDTYADVDVTAALAHSCAARLVAAERREPQRVPRSESDDSYGDVPMTVVPLSAMSLPWRWPSPCAVGCATLSTGGADAGKANETAPSPLRGERCYERCCRRRRRRR